MNLRRKTTTVSFAFPFAIGGILTNLPAGDYEVIVDEERLSDLSFVVYKHKATYLLVQNQNDAGNAQMYPIDPQDLQFALSLDRKRFE